MYATAPMLSLAAAEDAIRMFCISLEARREACDCDSNKSNKKQFLYTHDMLCFTRDVCNVEHSKSEQQRIIKHTSNATND